MRLGLFNVLSSARTFTEGLYALSLYRFITAFEDDSISYVKYEIEQQRNPRLLIDATLSEIGDLLDTMYPDAAFLVNVLTRDGRLFDQQVSLMASKVVFATRHPENWAVTILFYEEDKASPLVRYELDMPLITYPGGDGTTGFLNLFNSDPATGVAEALPTSTLTPTGTGTPL